MSKKERVSTVVNQFLMGWDEKLPVDPAGFARANGIAVKYSDKLTSQGLSGWFSRSEKTIYINPDDSTSTQRFTTACQLGVALFADENNDSIVDIYRFTLELLMPENAIRVLSLIKTSEEMTEIFDVSRAALSSRLIDLGYVE